MLGERAGAVHRVEDQRGEELGPRHAGLARAGLGQGGPGRAQAGPERGGKTGRGWRPVLRASW